MSVSALEAQYWDGFWSGIFVGLFVMFCFVMFWVVLTKALESK